MVEHSSINHSEDGGSTPAPPLHFSLRGDDNLVIREIPLQIASGFVAKHHYSKVMPKLNKVVMGLFRQDALVGCITFGWGVRPKDTIKNIFPSLEAQDYLEIGKLCLLDELPKNSESRFITAAMRFLKKLRPSLKLVFTWADAIWGKPGYIYQASNFWYGGAISSEAYRTAQGERVHPRQLHKYLTHLREISKGNKGRYVTPREIRDNPGCAIGNWAPLNGKSGVRRPAPVDLERLGMSHVRGKQFRYVHFLCPDTEAGALLSSCKNSVWSKRDYPKAADCTWTIKDGADKGFHPWTPPENAPVFSAAFDTR